MKAVDVGVDPERRQEQVELLCLLGLLGGAIGTAIAYAGVRVLKAVGPQTLPRLEEITMRAMAKKPKGTNWRAIDWESISLWNPDWKVSAPDFERTPVKLADTVELRMKPEGKVHLFHPETGDRIN